MLAALVAGGVVLLLLRRGRARQAWQARLAAAEAETGWFARDLVPQLRGSASASELSAGWAVASPRVVTLGDQLSLLASTAPDDQERARATTLRDAVRTALDRMNALTAAGADGGGVARLDEVQAPLLAALVPPPQTSPPAAAPPEEPPPSA